MPIATIQQKPKQSGGGLFGEILGGLSKVAGIVAPFTGAAAPIVGGAAAAAGTLASAIDPAKITNDHNVTPLSTMANNPGVQIARIGEFENAVKNNGNIPTQDAMDYLDKAKLAKQSLMTRYGRA